MQNNYIRGMTYSRELEQYYCGTMTRRTANKDGDMACVESEELSK